MEGATQKMRGELDKLNQTIIIPERSGKRWADRKMMTSWLHHGRKSVSASSAAHLLRSSGRKRTRIGI
jgi:hypothetical protein